MDAWAPERTGRYRPTVPRRIPRSIPDEWFNACVRCSLLRPDPAQRGRLEEIRDNLLARIAEAEREGWLGEVEGLRVSLAGAIDKLAQVDALAERQSAAVQLGMPGFSRSRGIAGTPRPTS